MFPKLEIFRSETANFTFQIVTVNLLSIMNIVTKNKTNIHDQWRLRCREAFPLRVLFSAVQKNRIVNPPTTNPQDRFREWRWPTWQQWRCSHDYGQFFLRPSKGLSSCSQICYSRMSECFETFKIRTLFLFPLNCANMRCPNSEIMQATLSTLSNSGPLTRKDSSSLPTSFPK